MSRRESLPDSDVFDDELPPIHCDACEAAIQSPTREVTAFLLLDTFTVPIVGCSDHLEQFRSVCGHTTPQHVDLLEHLPAGGINCPGCQLAHHNPYQPMIPVGSGMITPLACQSHQSELINRFNTGIQTQQHLSSSLDSLSR